ncbi:MAG: NAD(P)-dependent oxidoreductase [Bdellovibrionales bacterium]
MTTRRCFRVVRFYFFTLSANPGNKNLVDSRFLGQMKSSAFLINTARGPIVNEVDLAHALANGTIAGAGLDVLCQEPPEANNSLLQLKHQNLIITPHTAWASKESQLELFALARKNLEEYLQ